MRVRAADVRQRVTLTVRFEDLELVAAEEREATFRRERVPALLELDRRAQMPAPVEQVDHLPEDARGATVLLDPVQQLLDDTIETAVDRALRVDQAVECLLRVGDMKQAGSLGLPETPATRLQPLADELEVGRRHNEDGGIVAFEARSHIGRDGVRQLGRLAVDLDPVCGGAGTAQEVTPGLAHELQCSPLRTTFPECPRPPKGGVSRPRSAAQ